MNFLIIVLSFLLIFVNIEIALSWKNFWKGRKNGGNLGEPSRSKTLLQLPKDEWFDQILDHFDKTNNGRWKQVTFCSEKYP